MAVIASTTVKIGADTKDFIKGMNNIDKSINQTVKTADYLTKALEIEYDESQFLQAQSHVQSALDTTRDKAEQIRTRLKQLEDAGRIDTVDYQRLQTELAKTEANSILLEKKLKDIQKIEFQALTKQITTLGDNFTKAGRALAPLSIAAGAAGLGMLKLAKDAVEAGDEIATAGDKYGLSAEKIQALNYAALQSDVPAETLYKAYSKARIAIGTDLADGASSATKALTTLGVKIDSYRNQEEVFYGIIDALAGIEDSTMQAYYANEIFGERIATDLIPLLAQGEGAIKSYNDEFAKIGGLTNEQVQRLAEFDNELNRLTTQFENVKLELGTAFLPVLKSLADFLSNTIIPIIENLTNWFSNLSDSTKNIIFVVLGLTATLSPLLLGIGQIIKIIPSLLSGLSLLAAHPVIAIIGVVVALLTILYNKNEAFRDSINNLIETLGSALQPVFQQLSRVLLVLVNALNPVLDIIGDLLATMMPLLEIALKPLINQFLQLGEMLEFITPFIETIGTVFEWLESVMEPIVKVIDKITGGLKSIFGIKSSKSIDVTSTFSTSSTPTTSTNIPTLQDYERDLSLLQTGTSTNSVVSGDTNITINIYDADQKTNTELINEINAYFRDKKLAYR